MQRAFELVGQVVMQELMTNTTVVETISGYTKCADMAAIQQTVAPQ